MGFEVYRVNTPKKRNFFEIFSVNTNLIIINVILFFVFSILLLTGLISIDSVAIKPSNIFQGKYLWTFITSMFMHGGFFHLFANMFSLFFVGGLIEKLLGKKRFFWFYLLSGLFAGVFFVLVSYLFLLIGQVQIGTFVINLAGDFNTFAVGASGALFGLIGLLMLLTPNLPVYIMFIPIPVKIKYAAPGMLILLWLISVTGGILIGNTAHLGGLIAGLVYGIYLRMKFPKKTQWLTNHFR